MMATIVALLEGADPIALMIQEEQRRFPTATVVQAGHELVPLDDWRNAVLTLRMNGEVRVVLLDAAQPGAGALTRLLARLEARRLRPVVVAPSARLAAALTRRGWRWRRGAREMCRRPARLDRADGRF